ncbi:MAG: MFS transporter [Actinobacteria bacterium]|nr:MFS transporter [Actinomycetota bacterium]
MTDAVGPAAAEPEEPPRSALRILATRDFGPYFAGNLTSSIGTWFQNLAAAVLVYRLTGSTLLVGVVNFAQFIGAFVLAPWAGSAADRYDRRRLLLVTQVVALVVTGLLAAVTITGHVTAPIVIGAAFLLGFALAFMVPALLSLVPLLVPRRDLEVAVSLNSVTFNLARGIGPVVGAVVIDRYGIGPAFAINAASFLALIAALFVIRPREQAIVVGPRPKLRESIALVREDEVLTALLVVVMAVSTTTDPVNTLTPEFATRILGRADTVAGWLIGAFGGGATLTAVLLTGWLRRRRNGLVGAMVAEGAGIVVFALAPNLLVALLGMAIAGGGFIGAITRSTTRLQNLVADEQLGRVMALWSLAFIGTRPLAALVDGLVADVFGVRVAGVMMALPVLLAAVWVHRLIVRRRADPDAPAGDPGDAPATVTTPEAGAPS